MKICLVSGHKKNWDAGASTVYLHLDQELQKLGQDCTLYNAEDYFYPQLPDTIQKIVVARAVTQKLYPLIANTDVLEVAGNLGWHLFDTVIDTVRTKQSSHRPLLVTRLHGLEFKDEQARIDEEIAQIIKLPHKYRLMTRHWLNWQEFRSISLADIVICHSSREADAIITAKLKCENSVYVMPLGVDECFFLSRSYADVGNKLLWWGSWIERKGISSLPGAFEQACRHLPDLTLTIGGTGIAPEVVLKNFDPALHSRITVLPFVSREEHIKTLREHDIFLFPSLSEGFGFALLEAMATGMPCVTTFTGLAHDWLEHGDNSFLVPMSAPTPLARAIIRLHSDVRLRTTLGLGGHTTACKLTWGRLGENTERVYSDNLLSSGQKA